MMEQTNCPLCKHELKKVFSTKDYLVSGKNFGIMECSNCRLRLTNPFPGKNTIGDYYESDDYISHTDKSKSLFDLVYNLVRTTMLGRKKRLVEKSVGKKSGTIMDIGCGAGHFLNTMKENGWKVSGVDASSKASELVNNLFGISILSPEEWLNSDEKYDVITCWHSLEHVHEPWIYLEKFRAQLNRDGVLIVALPNYESTDAKKYGADWAAYDAPRHLYHFTRTSVGKIMKVNGFSMGKFYRMPFDGFYISILSARHKGDSTLSGIWNGFISWFVPLLNKERCSSLIYVMK